MTFSVIEFSRGMLKIYKNYVKDEYSLWIFLLLY